MSFPPCGVWNTNIPVPILTFQVLYRTSKLYYQKSTNDFLPFQIIHLSLYNSSKNSTFDVCKPPTHLDYLLDLKQIGGQSVLFCIKTKDKMHWTFPFKCKAKCWGWGVEEERRGLRRRKKTCHCHNPQWATLPHPGLPCICDLPKSFTYRHKA